MNRRRLLQKLASGSFNNVSFADARNLVEGFGFKLARTSGSHHIFIHQDIPQQINIQNSGGQAKPYQLRQLVRLIEMYNMILEDDD